MTSRPPIRIRRLTEQDREGYRTLRLRSLREDPMAFGSTLARELDYPPEKWEGYVRRGSTAANEAAWVAERAEGGLVGMVVGLQGPDRIIHVYAMWVEPDSRSQGIGGALLDELLRWAAQLDPSARIVLSVNPAQVAARKLYLGRGFRPTGVTEPIGHTPGVHVEELELSDRVIGAGATPGKPGPTP